MATILKDLGAVPGRRVDALAVSAREAARKALDEAAEEARRLVAAAESRADQIREDARCLGRAEGRGEAAAVVAAAAVARDRLLSGAERELIALAIDVARRIVGVAAERVPDVAVESAGRVLAAARHRSRARLRVCPEDAAAVRRAAPRLTAGGAVEVVEDAAVGRGGAILETDAGTIEADLERQLAALALALAEGEP